MAFLCMWCPVYIIYARLSSLQPLSILEPHIEVLVIADEVSLPHAWKAILDFVAPPLQGHPAVADPIREVEFWITPIIYADDGQ